MIKFFIILSALLLLHCFQDQPTLVKDYSFFVAGHAYGHHDSTNAALHPPFLTRVQSLVNDEAFIIFTGDAVRTSNEASWKEFHQQMATIGIPFYLTMGNHDVSDYATSMFVEKWGKLWYHFEKHGDLFLVLNSEESAWSIPDDQIAFLAGQLSRSRSQRIFIFMHSLLWLNHTPKEEVKYDNWNHKYFSNTFWTHVFPILKMHKGAEIFVVAGDVGGNPGVIPAFYQKIDHVHLVASGMGHSPDDNFLRISVGSGKTRIDVLPIDDIKASHSITEYEVTKLGQKYGG